MRGAIAVHASSLDEIDEKIITLLQQDGRMTHAAIAGEVGLTPPSVFERVRKLEQRGIIDGYTARINSEAFGKVLTAFIRITISDDSEWAAGDDFIRGEPDILEGYHVAGEDCIILKAKVAAPSDLEALLLRLRSALNVQRTITMIALRTIKEDSPINIGAPAPAVSLVS